MMHLGLKISVDRNFSVKPSWVPPASAASVYFDFAAGRYWSAGRRAGSLADILAKTGGGFERASVGTYFDAAGILRTAAIDAPRFERGCLLAESSTTNESYWFSVDPLTNVPVRAGGIQVDAPPWSPADLGRWGRITHVLPSSSSLYGNMAIRSRTADMPLNVSAFVHAPGGPPLVGAGETDEIGLGVYANGYSHGTGTRIDLIANDVYRVSCAAARTFSGVWMAPAFIHAVYSGRAASVERLSFSGFQATDGPKLHSPIITAGSPATRAADYLDIALPAGNHDLTAVFDDGTRQQLAAGAAGTWSLDAAALNRPHISQIIGVPAQ